MKYLIQDDGQVQTQVKPLDMAQISTIQLEQMKRTLLDERHRYINELSDCLSEALLQSCDNTYEFVIQQVQTFCSKLNDSPLWILKEITDELQYQLEENEAFLDDQICMNLVIKFNSSFNEKYTKEFNQIASRYLQNLRTHQLKVPVLLKRKINPQFTNDLISNPLDRRDLIIQAFHPIIQNNENIPQDQIVNVMEIEENELQFPPGGIQNLNLVVADENDGFIAKQLNSEVKQQITYGIDQEVAKKFYLLLPHYDNVVSSILRLTNRDEGNFLNQLTEIYNLQITIQGWPELFINKGLGLICFKKEGFQANEFLNFYTGEVYTSQRWFEKQTILQKRLQDGNRKAPSYFPFAEVLINNQLFFIDPARYGNYTHVIQYSCDPNCKIVPTLINGDVKLAIITTRRIYQYEELTLPFPYTSKFSCYCGKIECQREISIEQQQRSQMENYPCYVERNSILLRASLISQFYYETPEWLFIWQKMLKNQDQINITSCVDKALYVLDQSNTKQAPLSLISNVMQLFWQETNSSGKAQLEQSIISEIVVLLKRHKCQPECQSALQLIEKTKNIIICNEEYKLQITRMLLLILSEIILNITNNCFNSEGLSTILYYMAFTHTYFKANFFKGFGGNQFELSEFEEIHQPKNKPKLTLEKQYTPQFIWGQLVNWNKQTLQNPQSSMAQERRGVLCYPSLVLSFDNKHSLFPFQCKSRAQYLEYMSTKTEIQPDLSTWSYKNQFNVYGTIFFEQYFSLNIVGEDFLKKLFEYGRLSRNQRLDYWFQIEYNFCQEECQINKLREIYEMHFLSYLMQIQWKNGKQDLDDFEQLQKKQVKEGSQENIIDDTEIGIY